MSKSEEKEKRSHIDIKDIAVGVNVRFLNKYGPFAQNERGRIFAHYGKDREMVDIISTNDQLPEPKTVTLPLVYDIHFLEKV